MSTLRRDLESTVLFAVFPFVYGGVTVALAKYANLERMPILAQRRDAAFALAFGFVIVAVLVASMSHAVAFGWIRSTLTCLSLRESFLLQVVVAVASGAISALDIPLVVSVLLIPAGVTMVVYLWAERLRKARIADRR